MFCYRFFSKFWKTKEFQIGKEPDGRLAGARACRHGRDVWATLTFESDALRSLIKRWKAS